MKDNRTNKKTDGVTLPGSSHNGDSSNENVVSNVGDKRYASSSHMAIPIFLIIFRNKQWVAYTIENTISTKDDQIVSTCMRGLASR